MKKILIIESDKENRNQMVEIMRGLGYITIEASNGQEGLYIATLQNPDLVVIATRLPEMKGYELMQMLRKNTDMAFTPFVFLCNAQSETGIIGQSPMSHIQCIQLPLNKAEIKKTIEKNLQTGSNELMAFERTYDEVLTSINNYERRDYNMFLNIITGFTHLLIHFNCLPTQKRNNFLMAIYNSGISLKRLLATIHTDTEPQKGFLVPIIFQYD